MLNVENRFMIKDLYRQGVSISEIARRTGHDRKTIRHIIQAPLLSLASNKVRRPKARRIDPYVSYLLQRMEIGVLNARKLYGEIKAQGYPGKETQVRDFVHAHRTTYSGLPLLPSTLSKLPTVRFETPPGEQAQVDWGSFGFMNCDGHNRRLYGFIMTLGWSRAMYLEFTLSADTAWWLRCHLHAFAYFSGVPNQILHDKTTSRVPC